MEEKAKEKILKKKYSLVDFHKRESVDKDKNEANKLFNKNTNLNPNTIPHDLNVGYGFSNKNLPMMTTPRTNIEKIIETLNDIADEFDLQNKPEFCSKTQWVIKEILSNKMYKYEETTETSAEESKLFQFYSPDYEDQNTIKRDIIEENEALETDLYELEKENNQSSKTINSNMRLCINIKPPTKTSSFINTSIAPLKPEEFGPEFDVFDYAEKVGRENLLRQVFRASITYKDTFNLLKSSKIDNYIEELRKGYTSEKDAFYHNVCVYSYII